MYKARIIPSILNALQFIGSVISHTNAEVVHIFGQTPHHYVPMKRFFTQQVAGHVSAIQHFWAWKHQRSAPSDGVVYYSDSKDLIQRMKSLPSHAVFIFHGMFDRSLWPKLLLSKLPSRCSWVCWGADLHQHSEQNQSVKRRLMYLFHIILAARFKKIYALNQGDNELIKKVLFASNVEVLPYPLIASQLQTRQSEIDHSCLNVLLGNSAAPSNLHDKAIKLLSRFSSDEMRVVAPLNYGGPVDYIESTVSLGKRVLHEKFTAVTDMLDQAEYDTLLAEMDVVVFAHKRQQGLYVIYSALKNGQKVFVDGQSSTYHSLLADGFHVYKTESIANMSFDDFKAFSAQQSTKNSRLMLETFSEKALAPKWASAVLDLFKKSLKQA